MKEKISIRTPVDAVALLKKWANHRQENFLAITLTCKHEVIRVHHITKGILNKTIVHPRECFFPVIRDNASAVMFAHNHPSGYKWPSQDDDDICKRLEMASEILGFHMIDNIIITNDGSYYSYAEEGKMENKYTDEEISDFVDMIAAENMKGGQ